MDGTPNAVVLSQLLQPRHHDPALVANGEDLPEDTVPASAGEVQRGGETRDAEEDQGDGGGAGEGEGQVRAGQPFWRQEGAVQARRAEKRDQQGGTGGEGAVHDGPRGDPREGDQGPPALLAVHKGAGHLRAPGALVPRPRGLAAGAHGGVLPGDQARENVEEGAADAVANPVDAAAGGAAGAGETGARAEGRLARGLLRAARGPGKSVDAKRRRKTTRSGGREKEKKTQRKRSDRSRIHGGRRRRIGERGGPGDARGFKDDGASLRWLPGRVSEKPEEGAERGDSARLGDGAQVPRSTREAEPGVWMMSRVRPIGSSFVSTDPN
mmetsp:Transcript_12108/g.29349  ORF Transcript_12108/g.29349 Transcript_12108/m.29349 type:complete len:325 (-) Transcript_12108:546-1520(-)